MKIQRVRFFNLNSLRGEHEVHFGGSPLADAGLFAITGPTGAGKTTILDAITLALYGQVPRHEAGGPEQVMSHGTGESWAEVEFEVNGRLYRAKWGQYRARRHPGGKLQDPRMELSERQEVPPADHAADAAPAEERWEFLETYKSKVPARVAELSGLEYKQFLRSVLLAQGDFTKFLKAPAGERAQLLEKITDTRKYSDISKAAFDRAKREAQQVETLRTGLAGVVLLSDEEVAALEADVAALQGQLLAAQHEQQRLHEAATWQRRLAELATRHDLSQRRLQTLADQAETLAPVRQRMATHEQALPFRTPWALLQQADTQIARLHSEAEQLRQQLPQLEERLAAARHARQHAQQTRDAAHAAHQQQEPQLREAERLDSLVAQAEAQLQHERQAYDERNEQCKRLRAAAEQATARRAALQEQLRAAEKWLVQHARLAELSATLPELAAHSQDWDQLRAEHGQLSKHLADAEKRQQQAATAAAQHQHTAAEARAQLGRLDADLATAAAEHAAWLRRLRHHTAAVQRELEQEQQHWDDLRRSVQFQQLILSHAETRQLLESGQPCPVCGATEHPYAAGILGVSEDGVQRDRQREEELSQRVRALGTRFNRLNTYVTLLEQQAPAAAPADHDAPIQLLREADEKPAAEQVKSLVKHLQDLTQQRAAAALRLAQADTEHRNAAAQQQEHAHTANQLREQLADATERMPHVRGMLASLLGSFGLAFNDENGPALMELAGRRSNEFVQKRGEQEKGQEESNGLQAVLDANAIEQTTLTAWLKANKQALLDHHAAIQTQKQQRQALFAGPDVAAARQQLHTATEQATRELERQQQLEQEHDTALALAAATLRQRQADAEQQRQQRQQQHAALVAGLSSAGLAPDPAALPNLLLDDHEVRRLAEQLRQHEHDVAATQQGLADAAQQLQHEQARALTAEPAEAVQHQLDLAAQQLAALNQQLGQRQERLHGHRSGLERHAALAAELEKQRHEARRWRQLADLIGSESGKKFSEFAQGLTLARLVELANRHLHRLTDRYRILRHPDEHLDLLVLDEYQAGSTRTMNSLSGGESFLVSLALALGLSELAGRKTQIDTLFIDEGFGTLDPDTLDVALSALETLQGTGKTIGIISHVEALKERVSTQVNVRKGAGGVSSLRVVGFGEEL